MNSTSDLPIQTIADPAPARNENENILAAAQPAPALYPEDWWLEEKSALQVLSSSAPALPESYDAVRTSISPQAAGTVLTSTDGFRYGYYTCTDPNGTTINLSDTVTPEGVPLHTMQGSVIEGHSTADDSFSISSDYHHAMVDSILITGGGWNNIEIKNVQNPYVQYYTDEEFEVLAGVNGRGFGLLNSSILATESKGVSIDIDVDVCAVYGAHSPGATSIATGRGDDTISIYSLGRGIQNASIHTGDGNDWIQIESWDTVVLNSAIHLGDGDDSLYIGAATGKNYGYISDSTILTGKGNDVIGFYHTEPYSKDYFTYFMDNSYIILGEGNDTISSRLRSGIEGGGINNSSIFLEDYTGNAGDKTITLIHGESAYVAALHDHNVLNTSEINLGNGNDSITIASRTSAGTATIIDSYIITGEGNDTLDVTVAYNLQPSSTATFGSALDNTFVNMGGGNDLVNITGDVLRSDLYGGAGNDVININGAVTSSTISLGTGNDVLRLSATPGSAAPTPGSTGATLDGGSNITLNYAQGKLGDILSLDQSYFNHFKSSPITTIRNFEALNLDFSDGQREALDLDSLLSGIRSSTLKNANVSSLIISGDNGDGRIYDSIDLGGSATYKGGNISVDGMDQTYNWYTAYEGTSQQIEVFVATGMLIA